MNIHKKSENLYIVLTAIFIASLVSCNLIFQKFFEIEIWLPFIGTYKFEQSVGLLPYPITEFIGFCTILRVLAFKTYLA